MTWAVYVRRSYKRADAAAVSDETQEKMARALIPAGATVEVYRDSGGHRSGASLERDGYRELIAAVRAGHVSGVAVYDLSRLHRNTENMLALARELESRRIPMLIATMPTARFDGAAGRLILSTMAGAAQFQRDIDSERMKTLTRSIFESGGHRGLDPFGYRTVPGTRPRTLEVVEVEAEVVRRIWRELATNSTEEIALGLNRDGITHRIARPWTRDAVKDIARRGRFYLGYVTHKRGLEERPGRHPAIIDEFTWSTGFTAMRKRLNLAGRRPEKYRSYMVAGVIVCPDCGGTMTGKASTARGQEWRYYICRRCRSNVQADKIEAFVLDRFREGVLSSTVIDAARENLRELLALPRDEGALRKRLEQRRDRLAQLFAWGDLDEVAYRTQKAEIDAELAGIITSDKLLIFDRHRTIITTLAENVDRATPEQLREMVRLLVASVTPANDPIIEWTGPARPFFACVTMAPPDGLEPPKGTLSWYAVDSTWNKAA